MEKRTQEATERIVEKINARVGYPILHFWKTAGPSYSASLNGNMAISKRPLAEAHSFIIGIESLILPTNGGRCCINEAEAREYLRQQDMQFNENGYPASEIGELEKVISSLRHDIQLLQDERVQLRKEQKISTEKIEDMSDQVKSLRSKLEFWRKRAEAGITTNEQSATLIHTVKTRARHAETLLKVAQEKLDLINGISAKGSEVRMI